MPKSFKTLLKEAKKRIMAMAAVYLFIALALLGTVTVCVVATPAQASSVVLNEVNVTGIETLGDTLIALIIVLIPIMVILAVWTKMRDAL